MADTPDPIPVAATNEAEYQALVIKYTNQIYLLGWLRDQVSAGVQVGMWHDDDGYAVNLLLSEDPDDYLEAHADTFHDALVAIRDLKKAAPNAKLWD